LFRSPWGIWDLNRWPSGWEGIHYCAHLPVLLFYSSVLTCDLHIWLLFVLFVAKMSPPGFTYILVSRKIF
jgi:hypothetical protein